MKTIDANWEPIVRINCSCLGGKEYIEFHRDKTYHENSDSEAYYVKFIDENDWSFGTRLRTFFKYRKEWKKFINGDCQSYNGLYLNYKQLDEFFSIIINDAKENEIILNDDIDKITSFKKKDFEKYKWENSEACDVILFKSKDDFVFSLDIQENIIFDFKFSWAFSKDIKKKDINRYTRNFLFKPKHHSYLCKENEIFLYKKDLVELLSVMNFILKNTIIDGEKYKISL